MTLNLFNTPTDNLNDEMDEADIETNLNAEEVEGNANTNKIDNHSGNERMETCA